MGMPDDSGAALICDDVAVDLSTELRSTTWPRVNKRAPTTADAGVGRRIRDLRTAIGMPLAELSVLIGVSQPQLYRYESGLTRVAASRLIAIAGALGVSVEALTGPEAPAGAGRPEVRAEAELLLRAFNSIAQAERRSALIALARSMAAAEAAARPAE